jgi:type I restriction enzyme R subunit
VSKLTEDAIEKNFIELLQKQGYEYFHASELERDGYESVVLESEFKASLKRLNPKVPESARVEAYREVLHVGSSDLMASNEKFHNLLCEGVTVEYEKDGETKGINVKLLDLEKVELNSFFN